MARVWYIENEEGTHAIIGEYSACGMAFDELNGVENTSPIVTCDDCVDNIRLLRRVQTRRRTQLAPDGAMPSITVLDRNTETGSTSGGGWTRPAGKA